MWMRWLTPLTARWNCWWINDKPSLYRTPVRHNNNGRGVTRYLYPADAVEDKYRQLILLGKQLPALPDECKAQAKEIAGCENRVWLGFTRSDNGAMHFFGDSEGGLSAACWRYCSRRWKEKTPPNCRLVHRWRCLMSWAYAPNLAPHVVRVWMLWAKR